MSSGLIVALELALVLGLVLGLAFLELYRLHRDKAPTAGTEQSKSAAQSADAARSASGTGHAKG